MVTPLATTLAYLSLVVLDQVLLFHLLFKELLEKSQMLDLVIYQEFIKM